MLEEWTWAPDTLRTFARHHETGEPIPVDLVERMKGASEFGKGLYVRQQMFYAALSLDLHTRTPDGLDTSAVVAELQARYTPFAFVPGTSFEASFTHLDGYSALYYTYMWSLVIAKDMFTMFNRSGLLDAETAARYRRFVLEPGSSKPAADLVADFLGRPYSFAASDAWLAAAPPPSRAAGLNGRRLPYSRRPERPAATLHRGRRPFRPAGARSTARSIQPRPTVCRRPPARSPHSM
jgi:thimet oligopeptidase